MKILIKLPRFVEVDSQQRIVSKGGQWYIRDETKGFSTDFGEFPKELLQIPGKHVVGKETYAVIDPTLGDIRHRMGHSVQKIVDKDLGFIAAYTGVGRHSVFGEAGTGSGGATSFFAPLVKEVVSYDIRSEAKDLIAHSLEQLNITNVTFHVGDVCNPQDIKEDEKDKRIDVFLLDVPEPWRAWESMNKVVKQGGWVVGYTPNANQLQQFVNAAPENFLKMHACELIQRHWRVKGLVCRPETADFSHTAFLSFFRRIF